MTAKFKSSKPKPELKTIRVDVGLITSTMLGKLRRRGDVKESTLYPPRRGFTMTSETLRKLKGHPSFRHVFNKATISRSR